MATRQGSESGNPAPTQCYDIISRFYANCLGNILLILFFWPGFNPVLLTAFNFQDFVNLLQLEQFIYFVFTRDI